MRIKYLKLRNFKRFPFRDVEIFEEDFSSNRLIGILGCNGSGKSSLLRELSPFPSSKEHFFNNGEKEIHIVHNNNFYVLKSLFSKDENTFSFLLNDEELNTSNQVTIQKELIKIHFNLTEDIFDLLIGNTNFCDLNNLQRKKLFNTLTNLDIDKFLDIYEKMKEEEKFENNSFKLHLNNFTVESNKLEDKDKYKAIEAKKEIVSKLLSDLIEIRSFLKASIVNGNLDTNIKDFKDIEHKLNLIFRNYYTIFTSYPFNNLNSLYETYLINKNEIEKRIEIYLAELSNINKEINKLKVLIDADRDALIKEKNEKENSIKALEASLTIFKDTYIDVNKALEELLKVENALYLILDELESNLDKKYTLEKQKESKEREIFLSNHIAKLNEYILIEKGKLKHLEDYHLNVSIECPKCNYVFTPEVADRIKRSIEDNLKKLEEEVKAKEKELLETRQYNEKANKYFFHLENYDKITISSSILNELWEYIKINNFLVEDPKKILITISNANNDLRNIKLIKELKENTSKINEVIKNLEMKNNINLTEYENRYREIDECIQELLDAKKELETESLNLELSKKVYSAYSKLLTAYENNKDKVLTSSISVILENIISTIDSEITKLKASLIEYESYIKNYNNLMTLINKYKENIELSKKRLFVLNLLIKEISPKNGLIAKIISEYLNNIIKFMNKIVETIFEYNVKLSIIDLDNSVLDYKFKFLVENKIEVNDISKASSGMKEIFNLSFKLVLYKLLKLDNYPLYLDEFGVRLDTVHRNKIHNLIFKFINDTTFSQIFLVTHTDQGIFQYKNTKIINLS